jgi:hypothetical protein
MRIAAVAFAFLLGGCSGGAGEGPDDHTFSLPGAPGSDPSDAPPPLDECTPTDTTSACKTDSGAAGARVCETGAEGYVWSACLPASCQPGAIMSCGFPEGSPWYGLSTSCRLLNGEWRYDPMSCSTPLVLVFDDEPVTFTNAPGAFDLAGRETLVRTDWVSSETPWLVLDQNANGRIDDGAELFGSMTRLPSGARAEHGFAALAPLDADGDGWITASDPGFSKLALWRDVDQDRTSSAAELTPVAESVLALSLRYRDVPRCVDGNCERERAELVYRDRDGNERRGSVVDVYLAHR